MASVFHSKWDAIGGVGRMSEHLWSWTKRTSLPSRAGAHLPYLREILGKLEELGWEGHDLFGIEMALEESLSNAIRHGNRYDESKHVLIDCKASTQRFWIRIEDEGPGFRLEGVPDCTANENLERPGGRGIALITAFMTHVEFNQCGNCVTMEKFRSLPD
jgi:serine/threonine-protein kinase RsbW